MERARISTLHRVATTRKAGFLEACFKTGKISPDKMWLEWDDKTHAALRAEFNPLPPPAPAPRSRGRVVVMGQAASGRPVEASPPGLGLGDAVARVATPIARALGLPCVDKATGQLKEDSGCAQRKTGWNKVRLHIPFISGKKP